MRKLERVTIESQVKNRQQPGLAWQNWLGKPYNGTPYIVNVNGTPLYVDSYETWLNRVIQGGLKKLSYWEGTGENLKEVKYTQSTLIL